MNRMEDKVVIVTGGARALGGAACTALAAEGAAVVVADILQRRGGRRRPRSWTPAPSWFRRRSVTDRRNYRLHERQTKWSSLFRGLRKVQGWLLDRSQSCLALVYDGDTPS
jgi:nucleoside-diphosphate-sugar epimerase